MQLNLKKFAVMLCATVFFACNDKMDDLNLDQGNQEFTQENPASPENGTFVSAEQAKVVAEAFFSRQKEGTIVKSSLKSLSNVSIETVKDGSNPLMYVMNYPEGGWAIVSATRKYMPVLAYSNEGSFELKADEEMGPVIVWLEETKEAIRVCDDLDDEKKTEIRNIWNSFEAGVFDPSEGSKLKSMYDPLAAEAFYNRVMALRAQYISNGWDYIMPLSSASSYMDYYDYSYWCSIANNLGSPLEYTIIGLRNTTTHNTVGPLLSTKWSQNSPFNYDCPYNLFGNTYDAGCASVAVAQVMKYHQKPNLVSSPTNHKYNWNNMYDYSWQYSTPYSNYSTPYLIRDVANSVNMNWGILALGTFSWALPNDVESGIRSYGYTVSRSSHTPSKVKDEIFNYRPVIMVGGTVNLPDPLSYLGNGHYWVCDGAQYSQYSYEFFFEFINMYSYAYSSQGYHSPSWPGSTFLGGYLSFSMNWGWGGSKDAWFISNNVDSGNGNFQYGRQDFYIKK